MGPASVLSVQQQWIRVCLLERQGPVLCADYICAFKGVCMCVLVQVQQVRGAAG